MSDLKFNYLAIPSNQPIILPASRHRERSASMASAVGSKNPSRPRTDNSQAVSYTPPQRFYVPLPQLMIEFADIKDAVKPTAHLRRWNMILKSSLARHQLYHYLMEDVPPPNQDRTSVEYLNWRNDRFDIIELILASVQGIVLNMSDKGWYPSSDDPRHIYFKVFEAYGFNGPEDL